MSSPASRAFFSAGKITYRFVVVVSAVMLVLGIHSALAGSATWNLNSASGDWNTPSNWTPGTVPNGPSDAATFVSSNITNISLSADTEVNGIAFDAAANAFTITAGGVGADFTFAISGAGITNNSGVTQNFFVGSDENSNPAITVFTNNAAAGQNTRFTVDGGNLQFRNSSTAQGAEFSNTSHASTTNEGGQSDFSGTGSYTFFDGSATADSAMIVNNTSSIDGLSGGQIQFFESSSAGAGMFTNHGGATAFSRGGSIAFNDGSSGSNATFLNEGGMANGSGGGSIEFHSDATASSAVITNNGGSANGAGGAIAGFFSSSTAGESTLIANGGTGGGAGGQIFLENSSSGGTSRIKVFGNGALDISLHDAPGVTVGSLEGSGLVFLGPRNLTVGSNQVDTAFSGVIQDGGFAASVGGSITKIGSGILTFQLGASNNYIADSISLGVASDSTINLNFTGAPDRVRSLVVGGVAQAPGLYGSATSGAPNLLSQFTGSGKVLVTMAAFSRKGGFDVDLPFVGPPGVECRDGGANNVYQMVVPFVNAVAFDSASVTSGTGMVTSATGSGTTTVIVNLSGVTNAQTLMVTLFGVNDTTSRNNIAIPMSILVGDTSGNGIVNSTDVSQTKLRSGQAIDAANYRSDINANGVINATDVSSVKAKSGTALSLSAP